MSLTRPEGTALCSGQGEGVDPVPEDGAPGAGLCGSSRAWEPGRTRGPGLRCEPAGRREKAKSVEGPVF